jgi:hypothetical protein
MKRHLVIVSWFLLIGGTALLMSCTMPINPGQVQGNQEINLQYATVSAFLTETAKVEATVVLKPTVISTNTLAVKQPVPPTTVALVTEIPSSLPSATVQPKKANANVICDLAQAGKPIDITIPDDTRLHPGQYFSKTWRLVNGGNCSWTRDYSVVWFSGEQLGLSPTQAFTTEVAPGSYLDVTVEMIAPLAPGTYQSNWKLKNQQGQLFGIGPQGNAPFWAKIIVIPLDTPTPTPTLPLATATPAVFSSGTLTIPLDQEVDLDKGLVGQGGKGDLLWKNGVDGSLVIVPENGAKFMIFGVDVPEIQDCSQMQLNDVEINLGQLQANTYVCYRTSEGLPGRFTISSGDAEEHELFITYITWVAP